MAHFPSFQLIISPIKLTDWRFWFGPGIWRTNKTLYAHCGHTLVPIAGAVVGHKNLFDRRGQLVSWMHFRGIPQTGSNVRWEDGN
jgi:hypothetical protein